MTNRNALTSLWGRGGPSSEDHDMAMNDVKLHNGELTGERDQRVHTPQVVLDAVARLWPAGIALDAAGSPDSLIRAERWACPDDNCGADYRDGLAIDWPSRTFVNPEFANLKPWLEHGSKFHEVVLLGPVRTHRRWFQESVFGMADAICWLYPITFVGFDATFPAPLCIVYYGSRLEAFGEAFESLGHCSELSWRGTVPGAQMTMTFGRS